MFTTCFHENWNTCFHENWNTNFQEFPVFIFFQIGPNLSYKTLADVTFMIVYKKTHMRKYIEAKNNLAYDRVLWSVN